MQSVQQSLQPAGAKHEIYDWMKQSRGSGGGGRRKNIKQENAEERHSPESGYSYKNDLVTPPAPPAATAPMGSPNPSSEGSGEGFEGKHNPVDGEFIVYKLPFIRVE